MTQAADDLRVLQELADEIREFGYPGLPGALCRFLRTKRASIVGQELERLARLTLDQRAELAKLQQLVHHLREDIELTTDALLVEESRRHAGNKKEA